MSNNQQKETAVAANQPKALRVLASIVSYICHPVFMPLIMAVVLSKLSSNSFTGVPPKQLGLWFISIASTAVFFPLFSILLMKPLGFITSYHMPTARERTIPLMVTMIFYFWVSHVFNSIPDVTVALILKVLLLGNFWGVVVLFLINIFTKVSMHTAAAGGMVGILIVLMIMSPVDMVIPFFIALVIAGIIGTARLILGAHQRGDVWLGYIVGIVVQLAAYIYMK
ncbi:MAG: phosphatase PAP2 family protein [Taibaiella sp.]|nr:phosphatase PAP2 family protein [Taibaiella sp.]